MIRIFFFGPSSDSGGVANHTINLANILPKMDVELIWYKFKGSNISRIYNRTIGMLIQTLIRKDDYSIIHVQCSAGLGSFSSALTGAFASHLLNKKYIFTYHNSQILHRWLFRFCLIRADKIFLVSQLQRNLIQKYYPELLHKVLVISNGFDQNKFYAKNQDTCKKNLGLPDDKKILMAIGNLLDIKGHRYLIEAVDMIRKIRNDILCVIIGEGPLKITLSNQIENRNLEKEIFLIGGKPHDEIPNWMNACDLFILPSLNEGNPTVMFEALGCGKPFVGTKVGGVPEVIISEKYGLLVEPANPDDLADKILTALDRTWDQGAILHYAKRYTWENIAEEIVGVYGNFL